PKMRVPRGSPPSRINTAAFSSNLMYEPSARRRLFAVRTTPARTTSPFLTPAPGSASLTVPTMMSPIPAYRRPEPPSTRMQRISFAPVLSATRSRDSCWIIFCSLGLFEDLYDAPALGRRHRPGLHQQHAVA